MGAMKGIVCAAGLVVVGLVGCQSNQLTGFFALQSDSNGRERVVAASVDSVRQSAQATLAGMGMVANVSKQGDTVRIASKTARGTAFTLVLDRQMVSGMEHTRARIEWADGREDQVGTQVLAALDMVTNR
jgi:hypothetical protein